MSGRITISAPHFRSSITASISGWRPWKVNSVTVAHARLIKPEIEEFIELRKCRAEIVILPDIALQQPRVIRPPVESVGSGQPIALKLPAKVLRNHCGLHPITGNVLLTRSSTQVSKLKEQPLAPPIPLR